MVAVPSWNSDVAPKWPPLVRLSKIDNYLADNLLVFMLSDGKVRGQAESGWAADAVSNWESRTGTIETRSGKGWLRIELGHCARDPSPGLRRFQDDGFLFGMDCSRVGHSFLFCAAAGFNGQYE
jgi:hypothetical protein